MVLVFRHLHLPQPGVLVMLNRCSSALAFVVVVAACSSADSPMAPNATAPLTGVSFAKPVDPGYTVYQSGSTTDAVTQAVGGAYLAGGGTDVDAGMVWLMGQGGTLSPGKYGDVVVLRTSGSNGYNKYLVRLGANSVTSIVITSVAGANSDFVKNAIAKAEVVFLAGGDQSTYVNLWRGTALQTAVNARVAQGYPIGGTSAGLAVMGQYVYAALNASAESAIVLQNPFDASVTLQPMLFNVPLLANVLTDSHFKTRDRMGRLLVFLARLQQDDMATAPRAIAVDEGSGVGVAPNGSTTTFGTGAGAYYLSVETSATRVCRANTPLTYSPVTTVHVQNGQNFSLGSWTSSSVAAYSLSVSNGVVSSSTGSIY
jgi:cyanophycinase